MPHAEPQTPLLSPPIARRLQVHEVAYHFGRSQETIRRWIRSGKLIAYRIEGAWLVRLEDLQAFEDARRHQGNGNGHGS